jgi:hypothetical protein
MFFSFSPRASILTRAEGERGGRDLVADHGPANRVGAA